MGESNKFTPLDSVKLAFDNLKRIDGMLGAGNAKAASIISYIVAASLVAAINFPSFKTSTCMAQILPLAAIVAYILFFISSLWGLLFAALALKPNVKNEVGSSLFYFGSIVECEADTYADKFQGSCMNDVAKDLALQVHQNSIVAQAKFKMIDRAINGVIFVQGPSLILIATLIAISKVS